MAGGQCWWGVLLLVVVATTLVAGNELFKEAPKKARSCGEAGFCCQGRNNTCRAYGPRMKQDEEQGSPYCFCDSNCLELGDCCTDYKDRCHAEDCKLSEEWGPWRQCSQRCGWGIKERRKHVEVHPKNGGAKCPPHHQKLACYGINCKVARTPNGYLEMRETGKVIPAMYGTWRKNKLYNPYSDIRKNLFHHYSANSIIERPPYCARYEITEARRSCQLNSKFPWAAKLKSGSTVCVECQQLAMKKKLGVRCRGHGVYNKETSWNAISVAGCHGDWVMKSRHEECSCDPKSEVSFIFI